jgi:arabinose-5-phosphate isomerase
MGPDIEEACPLKLTPSATIAVMLAISDALALTLMELKGFTKEDYGMRHHKGYLGSISRGLNESGT